MPTDVVMPQMGESIAEGTIVRWIKKVGDTVDYNEPLFEISTDKVDAEIPSPAAGVLTAIRVQEGDTVPVNSVVAVIDAGQASTEAAVSESVPAAQPEEPEPTLPEAAVGQPEPSSPRPGARKSQTAPRGGAAASRASAQPAAAAAAGVSAAAEPKSGTAAAGEATREELRRTKSSPLVRRIAREHNIDIGQINGTGVSGRVTKHDILGFIESGAGTTGPAGPSPIPAFAPGERVRVEPMSVMRRKIAEHMVLSARTSPHVYSVYEVNFGRIAALREKRRADFEAAGARLTYTAFIARVTVDALRQFPVANSSIDGTNIVYKQDVNLGIAVALDNGLLVPVIRNADEKNLLGLSRAIEDLATRARAKKLSPEEVQGGTFTITNPGIYGALYGLPLINQPQVAILGVGSIDKRAVVIDDAIAIRPVCHLTLGFDHRIIDGAEAGRILSYIKERLEGFDEAWM
jgi:2-oxoglutarate dehydrogenase E2 component (dihydrolipoamide succinyltransferase)